MTYCLNAKGQCPVCKKKPLIYKRPPRHFCPRCDRAFSLDTGEQIENWAWKPVDGGFFPKLPGTRPQQEE